MINKSNIVHAMFSLAIMGVLSALTRNALASAMAGAWFYIGREWTQAEYRWFEKYHVHRSDMPWYAPLNWRVWDVDAVADWVIPCVACSVAYFVIA